MEQEVATNPVADAADAAPGSEVAYEADESENLDTEVAQQDDDSEEIEHEGQKYRLPKALKSALMMQADYTRKTQEVAETRKALEAKEQSIAQQAEAHRQHLREHARLVALDDQLEAWNKVNWQQLSDQDPQRTQALWIQYQQIKDARAQAAEQLRQKEAERASNAERESATRYEKAAAAIKSAVPNWSPEIDQKMGKFVEDRGLSRADVLGAVASNPKIAEILHLAFVGEQLIAKQRQAAKQPQTEAKPVPQVSSRSAPAAKDPEKMSTDEWMKWRNAQLRKREGR